MGIVLFYTIYTLIVFACKSSAYKHVIFMHGLLNGPSEFKPMIKWLQQEHPGTTVSVIDAYDDTKSLLTNMWTQTNAIAIQMQEIMNNHTDGVHLLCFSQGGLLCRGVIETLDKHNVENFVSLSSPQGGQFGDTSVLKKWFPHFVKEEAYEFFYSWLGQREISVANYWNDPHHQDLYLKYSNYLAVINNQTSHNKSHEYKANMCRLKNVVMIGGPDDGVITPWQSSQFAAYDNNEKVVLMQDQEWYKKDSFCLKTLDERKSLHAISYPGVVHFDWHKKKPVFDKCIKQWLT